MGTFNFYKLVLSNLLLLLALCDECWLILQSQQRKRKKHNTFTHNYVWSYRVISDHNPGFRTQHGATKGFLYFIGCIFPFVQFRFYAAETAVIFACPHSAGISSLWHYLGGKLSETGGPFHRTKCARTPQCHTHWWKHFVIPWLNSRALILQLIWAETNRIKI